MTYRQCASGGRVSNTLALPCEPRFRCTASNQQEVLDATGFARAQGLPLLPLGEGSNVVLPPRLQACVLRITDTTVQVLEEREQATLLRVGAGKGWHALVIETLAMQLYGLENLALIPGCVGAAPVQNIGAYGRELAEFVVAVHGVDLQESRALTLAAGDCGFAYRDSVFKHRLRDRFVITAVDLQLQRTPAVNTGYPALRAELGDRTATPQAVCDAVVSLRRSRLPDPSTHPNAGSFFKNPLVDADTASALSASCPELPVHPQSDGRCKLSAAWLIDACGLRGVSHGLAQVSDRHALVIETKPGASQADVLALAAQVIAAVAGTFGVTLEMEPRVYA